MRDSVETEKERGHIYGPTSVGVKTSNSVLRTALDSVGQKIDDAFPKGISKDDLPGIDNNLSVKSKPSQQQKPNPIEGEIGGTEDQKPTPPAPSTGNGKDNTSGDGEEGESQPAGLSAGTDAGDLSDASPEARKFMDDLLKPGKPVDEIMLKDPRDLTGGEVKEIMIARMDAKTNDERERLFKIEKGFFDHFFGNEPVGPDAAGRTMEPKPIRPIPEEPKPILTADGKPLDLDLKRIGRKIVRDAKDDGLASVIKRLQGGLNLLRDAKEPKAGFEAFSKLKEDGVPGPKTRANLRRAVAQLGAPRIEEGLALDRFNRFARDGQRKGFGRLGEITEKSFGPLFRGPGREPKTPAGRIEAVTLQETLNDLGKTQFGQDRFKPLKLDGDIGQKTTDVFSQIAGALGPEHVTNRFGEFLGFF